MNKFIDITGMKFGRLTAISKIKSTSKWNCVCDCGNSATPTSSSLRKGKTISCGCVRHGLSQTKLYRVYRGIRTRCGDKNSPSYKDYGGRGIRVCKKWIDSPVSFIDWCLKNGYREGLQIDRINNDGNYSPRNCRFVSRLENSRNKRDTVFIIVNGEKKTVDELADSLGIKPGTIYSRYKKGWPVSRIISTKLYKRESGTNVQ